MSEVQVIPTVRMVSIPINYRQVVGPKTNKVYTFNPSAEIDPIDVEDFLTYSTTTGGCSCSGGQKRIPLFAKQSDVDRGLVVPEWAPRTQHG